MDKKYRILLYISQNPGVLSANIKVNLSRSSIGVYARMLLDEGAVFKDEKGNLSIYLNYLKNFLVLVFSGAAAFVHS